MDSMVKHAFPMRLIDTVYNALSLCLNVYRMMILV